MKGWSLSRKFVAKIYPLQQKWENMPNTKLDRGRTTPESNGFVSLILAPVIAK